MQPCLTSVQSRQMKINDRGIKNWPEGRWLTVLLGRIKQRWLTRIVTRCVWDWSPLCWWGACGGGNGTCKARSDMTLRDTTVHFTFMSAFLSVPCCVLQRSRPCYRQSNPESRGPAWSARRFDTFQIRSSGNTAVLLSPRSPCSCQTISCSD